MLSKLLLYNKVNQLSGNYTLEKEVAPHPSSLAWETPWTEEPGGLQSVGSHRVRHDGAHTQAHTLYARPL